MVELQALQMNSVFHALGDATRRHMLRDLAGGERTVGQLAEPFSIALAAASKHIKVLEGAGLIRRAMQLMQVTDPRAVVKVGDTPSDLQSGRAAGCGLVVGVSYGTHAREELLRYEPDSVIDDLRELVQMVVRSS